LKKVRIVGDRDLLAHGHLEEEQEERKRTTVVKEGRGSREEGTGGGTVDNGVEAQVGGGKKDEERERLFEEMREIKRERERERERMWAKEKEWEHDKVRLEEEIRVLRREGERANEKESLLGEIEELKTKLAGRTSDGAWKTKPAVARKEFEEEGESEEMERLLEDNMVGRRNAPSIAKAPECFFVCCGVFVHFLCRC